MLQTQKLLTYTGLGLAAILCGFPQQSWGQNAALDDEDQGELDTVAEEEFEETMPDTPKARWGVGVRIREIFVPKSEIELFVEEATSGISHLGVGIEAIRRKGNFEIAVGIEQEALHAEDGLFVEKGDSLPAGVDDVTFHGFGWIALDANFIWHTRITDVVSLRYGGGFGLAIIQGEIKHTDYNCTSTTLVKGPGHCVRDPNGVVDEPYDTVPPVMLLVNGLLGLQIKPVDNVAINLEAGLRTVFYTGMTVAYFF